MSTHETMREIAKQAFADIHAKFPFLEMKVGEHPPDAPLEISAVMPAQPGLKYEVNLNLQNRDELHFAVSNFEITYFPCRKPEIVDDFIEAVSGFLCGEWRIEEYWSGKKCVKAQLQVPEADGWKTIGTWGNLWNFLPIHKSRVIIRNN